MKYINRFYAPSIELLSRDEKGMLSRIVLPQGVGSVTAEQHKALLESETIRDFVKDGYLEFPTCPEFRKIYGINTEARRARERELWGEQEDRANQVPQDLTELTEMVGKQAEELASANAQNADLLARLEKMEAALAAQAAAAPAPAAPAPVKAPEPPAAAPAPVTPPAPPAPAAGQPVPPPPAQ